MHYTKLILIFFLVHLLNSCDKDSKPQEEPDVIAPVIEFSLAGTPNNTTGEPIIVSNQIVVEINAQDKGGISKIEAFINNEKVGEDTSAPFSITIDVSSYTSKIGSSNKYEEYTLKVTATDIAGNASSVEQLINVDNEIPSITGVSLAENTILNGDTNGITFEVVDNEEISSVKLYLNEELLVEITDNFGANIDTSVLSDGENILKIEAKDLADNTATYIVNFIVDNSGPEISFENLTNGIIIDEILLLNPTATDQYSEVSSMEIKFNNETVIVGNPEALINFEFDPEGHTVGEGTFEIIATDGLGNTSSTSIGANIYRRLIEINIPVNRLNPAITTAVAFISRMDGSNVVWQEFTPADRQIIFSVPEAFDMSTEFMVSFFLKDNGGQASLTTHQNLTRGNPEILNLSEPVRRDGNGPSQVPIANFLSNDVLIGESGTSYNFFQSLDDSPASYTASLDAAQGFLNFSTAEDPLKNLGSFDQIYLYDLFTQENILMPNPPAADYVLDKANFRTDNLEIGQLVVSSPNPLTDNISSVLRIAGALSQEDEAFNKYHEIFVWSRGGFLDSPMDYRLNSTFFSYRHALSFGNYYTERNGKPLANYTIPDVTVDYTFANNQVDLSVQGTEHVVGRVQCVDFDNLNYVWNITFDSQKVSTVIVPELPVSISHPVKSVHQSGNIKVEKVELVSYGSYPTYEQYIQGQVKHQNNIIDSTDWYELVYKSRTGDFNTPIRNFLFQ